MLDHWVFRRWRSLSPPALFIMSFAALIGVGTLGLLFLPGIYTGAHLSALDALFTATSAVCVTGLIVTDTATAFTFWGQLWLLLLLQFGGLGLITMTSVIIGVLGRRLSLRTEMIAVPALQERHGSELLRLTWGVIRFTLLAEALLALLLWLAWRGEFDTRAAVWHAVFHAISAFCNAGFSTFSDSLMASAQRPFILLPLSFGIILGGFGYLSSLEIVRWWKAGGLRGPARLSIHTYAALVVSSVLLLGGSALFLAFEWTGVLADLNFVDKLVNAWFMSTTARTAGFNSIDYEQVGNQTAYLTILLMIIGGSPGSTAGGIKTTSVAILVAMAASRILSRRHVVIHDRTVPEATVGRAVSLTVLFLLLVLSANLLLTFSETSGRDLGAARQAFLPLLFEAASAWGTVGLSMGMTSELTAAGKVAIIVSMFMGRVGPLAFFAAISIRSAAIPSGYRPAREDMLVG